MYIYRSHIYNFFFSQENIDTIAEFNKLCGSYEKYKDKIKKKLTIFQMALYERVMRPIISKFKEDPHFVRKTFFFYKSYTKEPIPYYLLPFRFKLLPMLGKGTIPKENLRRK